MENNGALKISSKIYGREKEIEILINSFHRISEGEFKYITIKGNSGTGKTQLITRTLKPIINDGFFIYGKFEQFNFDQPYIAFVQAFKNLISQILTESKEEVKKWSKKLKSVLGRNGAVIARLIPEIESIMGKQYLIDEVDPQKIKRKFETVFKKFIQVLAVEDHPLVFFLDDLQWADTASLQLLKSLCENSQNSNLLIVGAYRNEEEKDIDLLLEILKEIEDSSTKIEDILLNNLSIDDTIKMVSDSLIGETDNAILLGEIIYRKTLGNPLFINQMLNLFYNEKYLYYDQEKKKWDWNSEYINSVKIPRNIVELVKNNLKKLSEETLECLKIASCIGTTFDLKTISMVIENTFENTMEMLMEAISEGLILPEAKHKGLLSKDEIKEIDVNTRFEFFHDRVLQGVCILMSRKEKNEKDLKIGRLLLKNTTADDLDKKILNIMVLLNHGLDMITDNHERIQLSEYNLIAGKKAKASTAWEAALKYLKAGIKLLPEDSWKNHYQLTYELYIEFLQSQYLTNHYEEAEELFEMIMEKVKTKFELAEIYYLKTVLFSSSGEYTNAIKTGIQGLKYLGINFPENPGKVDLLKEIIASKWYFRNKRINNLNMPQNNSPRIKKAQEILTSFGGPVNATNKQLYPLIIMKMVNLSGKYGATEYSTFGYLVYSFVEGTYLGNYKKGHEIEKTAFKIIQRYPDSNSTYLTYFFAGTMVSHWTQHAEQSLRHLETAYNKSQDSGDYIFAAYAFVVMLEMKIILGKNLNSIYQYCIEHTEIIKKMPNISFFVDVTRQNIEILEGKKENQQINDTYEPNNSEKMAYFIFCIQRSYLYGDYKKALEEAQKAQVYKDAIKGYISYSEYLFYYSLSITAVYDQLSVREQKINWKILNKHLKQFKKWSDNCPENFLHKYALICAERARIKGENEKAITYYYKAMHSSLENGYIQNYAIANELIAKLYIKMGKEKSANLYLNKAYENYMSWGAKGKADILKEQYKILDRDKEIESSNPLQPLKTDADDIKNNKLDLIMNGLQNISKQENEEKQLIELFETAVRITSSEKGCILIEKNDELYIHVLKEYQEHSVIPFDEILLEESHILPKKVIRYTARTYETVLITENISMSIFASDEYLIQNNPYSIICIPLKSQGIFMGVLYLENINNDKNEMKKNLEMLEIFSNNILYRAKNKQMSPKYDEAADLKLIQLLSKREREVLELIGQGLSNKEIAISLELTVNTVKTHTKNLYTKLGVDTRVQAVTRAKELGMNIGELEYKE